MNLLKILQVLKTKIKLNRLTNKNMNKNILDATWCEDNDQLIYAMQKDIKRRKSIGFKIKKFFKKLF